MCVAESGKDVAAKFVGVKWVGLTLIALLAFAVFDLAVSFGQFLNLAVTLGAAYLAAAMFANGYQGRMILAASVALLYNPSYPVDLDSDSWPVIHALCAILLAGLCWFDLLAQIAVDLGRERLKKIGKFALGFVLVALCGLGLLNYVAYRNWVEQERLEAARAKQEAMLDAEREARQRQALRGALVEYRKCREGTSGKGLLTVQPKCQSAAENLRQVDGAVFDLERNDERKRVLAAGPLPGVSLIDVYLDAYSSRPTDPLEESSAQERRRVAINEPDDRTPLGREIEKRREAAAKDQLIIDALRKDAH